LNGGDQNFGDASGGVIGGSQRQYARELQERYNELRELQRLLGPNNPLSRDLGAIANNVQGLMNDPRIAGNPQAIDRLTNQIIDPLRGVELELSRALNIMMAKENIRSAQEDEIPEGYQKLVEEYYKKLSSSTQKQ